MGAKNGVLDIRESIPHPTTVSWHIIKTIEERKSYFPKSTF